MSNNDVIRNKLTEHENNFRLCNLNLINCYTGLYPASLTKLSMVIFNKILSNKKYIDKNSQYYDEQESRRIYNNIPLSAADILEDCHPIKYRRENWDPGKDSGNLVKRIHELDDNNIFYVWKMGHPKNYIFILERDVGLWKYYNSKSFVTPKTLRKIIMSTKGICSSMYGVLSSRGDKVEIESVRVSFCKFVEKIVGKMNPNVNKNLKNFENFPSCKDYLVYLNKSIKSLDPYDGLFESKDFLCSLPKDVYLKIKPEKRKDIKISNIDKLKKEIGCSNGNIVSERDINKKIRKRNAKTKIKKYEYKNPLENSKSFAIFYRSKILGKNKNAKFNNLEIEVQHASLILDKIIESNCDEPFLSSWINFFYETKLKGNNIYNTYKTSLSNFGSTFIDYKQRYVG